jgi:hypothetical protein
MSNAIWRQNWYGFVADEIGVSLIHKSSTEEYQKRKEEGKCYHCGGTTEPSKTCDSRFHRKEQITVIMKREEINADKSSAWESEHIYESDQDLTPSPSKNCSATKTKGTTGRIFIDVILKTKKRLLKLKALVDSGSSKNLLNSRHIPNKATKERKVYTASNDLFPEIYILRKKIKCQHLTIRFKFITNILYFT